MRAQNDILLLIQRRATRQRLRFENIQGCAADFTIAQRGIESSFVDGGAAADVHDPSVAGEEFQALGVEGVFGRV